MPGAAPVKLSSLEIPGPAGPLEALLPSPAVTAGAALVAHPHPRLGGTMRTKVVHRAARGWTFLVVPGADHYFSGRLDELESATGDALAQWLSA
jgi:alpha/beta superfamily hydrolase